MINSQRPSAVDADHLIKIPECHPRAIFDNWIVMAKHIYCITILGDYGFHNGICNIVVVIGVVDVEKIHEFFLRQRNEFF